MVRFIKLDPNQQENRCSNKEHYNRYAKFKFIGYTKFYLDMNETHLCQECMRDIYFEMRDLI